MSEKNAAKRVNAQKARQKAVNKSVAKATPYIDEVVATKLLRDTSLREKQFFNNKLIIILIGCLVVSVTANFMLFTRSPDVKYFATDVEGKIKTLTALDEPVQGANEVLSWATRAITQSYTLSFVNYREQLQAAREHFTKDGFEGFESALTDSGILDAILENQFVTSAVPRGAPVIVAEGIIAGFYAYKVEVPVVVTYQSSSNRTAQDLLVTAVIVRRSELEHPMGLGIAQLLAE